MGRKKHRRRPRRAAKPSAAAPLAWPEVVKVVWALTVLTTVTTAFGAAVSWGYLAWLQERPAHDQLEPIEAADQAEEKPPTVRWGPVLSSLLHFASLVMGVAGLGLLAIVARLPDPPPRRLMWLATGACVAPMLLLWIRSAIG